MKNPKFMVLITSVVFALISCEKEEDVKNEYITGAYIIDYGNYTGSKTTISAFDFENDTIYHDVYKTANEVEILSNVQYAAEYKGKVYMASNEGDKIDIIDAKTFKANTNPISKDIVKPRYIVFNENMAYVSCWGNVTTDWNNMSTSYIATIDLKKGEVIKKLNLPGGPEGMAIVNGKLYAALNYVDSIAVIDLSNDSVKYIQTPAVSSCFLQDDENNLYVSLTSTYADFSISTGIGLLNTQSDSITGKYFLEGVSSNYASIMQFDSEKKNIYVMASSWVDEGDGNWVQKGSVQKLNLEAGTFSAFLENLTNINAISVNPKNDDVYCLYSKGSTLEGSLEVYRNNGDKASTYATGLSPIMTLFID